MKNKFLGEVEKKSTSFLLQGGLEWQQTKGIIG